MTVPFANLAQHIGVAPMAKGKFGKFAILSITKLCKMQICECRDGKSKSGAAHLVFRCGN
ncbi:hypothetical protein [Aquicoccus sp.]|uniref:hypothetical protein n=1 Tax=Aquicoccus sp. TaxID=2055851 RepID=UPI003564C836